jgi:hypothetical protein
MKYELYTRVALAADLPEHRLHRGDVATLVEFHAGRLDQVPGYTLEVFTATGETVTVVTIPESQIQPLNSGEVLRVRSLDSSSP